MTASLQFKLTIIVKSVGKANTFSYCLLSPPPRPLGTTLTKTKVLVRVTVLLYSNIEKGEGVGVSIAKGKPPFLNIKMKC